VGLGQLAQFCDACVVQPVHGAVALEPLIGVQLGVAGAFVCDGKAGVAGAGALSDAFSVQQQDPGIGTQVRQLAGGCKPGKAPADDGHIRLLSAAENGVLREGSRQCAPAADIFDHAVSRLCRKYHCVEFQI